MSWATPDSIRPSWVKWDDHGTDGHTYSQLRLPTEPLEYETCKHYLKRTDMYAHADSYPFSQEGVSLDGFTPFVSEVPADCKQPQGSVRPFLRCCTGEKASTRPAGGFLSIISIHPPSGWFCLCGHSPQFLADTLNV